jgi:hypothetical protein
LKLGAGDGVRTHDLKLGKLKSPLTLLTFCSHQVTSRPHPLLVAGCSTKFATTKRATGVLSMGNKGRIANGLITVTVVIFVMINGCASGPNPYQTEWEQKRQQILSAMVPLEKCTDETRRGKVLGNCDFVSEQFYSDLPKIKKVVCDKPKLAPSACGQQLMGSLFARFQLRYPYADWKSTMTWCQADPQDCDFSAWQGAEMFEMHLHLSNNKNVVALAKATQEEIQARADLDAAQRQKDFIDALSSLSQSSQPPLHCHSTVFGNTVNTNCS